MSNSDTYLNAANAFVCVLGTATADGLIPGAGSALSGGASFNFLRKALLGKTPELNEKIAAEIKTALESPTVHMPKDADKLIPQMIEFAATDPAEIMAAQRNPESICDAMLNKMIRNDHKRYEIQQAFRDIMVPILRRYLGNAETSDTLRPAFETAVAETMAYIAQQVDVLTEQFYSAVHELGVTKGAITELARGVVEDVEDHDTAMRELRRMVGIVKSLDAQALLPDNTGDQVQAIRHAVSALNKEGHFQEGYERVKAELQASRDRMELANISHEKLLDLGVEQAVLARDADGTARLLVEKVQQEVPDRGAWVGALREVFKEWRERGLTQALRFDMLVAIVLSRQTMEFARNADERGALWNDLGVVQKELGEREAGIERLEAAVAACENALLENTRERVPMVWAMTQMNLGSALSILGERESGTDKLQQAVEAYENALLDFTRERVPMDWAMTQMNLGNALSTLGERESGTDKLQRAVKAYENALLENTRERVPMEWAGTQMNLGVVAKAYFDKTGKIAQLDLAEQRNRDAREVFEMAGASYYLEMVDRNLAIIAKARQSLPGAD